jgi:hypothetical protein
VAVTLHFCLLFSLPLAPSLGCAQRPGVPNSVRHDLAHEPLEEVRKPATALITKSVPTALIPVKRSRSKTICMERSKAEAAARTLRPSDGDESRLPTDCRRSRQLRRLLRYAWLSPQQRSGHWVPKPLPSKPRVQNHSPGNTLSL